MPLVQPMNRYQMVVFPTLTLCRSGEMRLAEERMPVEALAGSDLILATVGVIGIVLGDELSCGGRAEIRR